MTDKTDRTFRLGDRVVRRVINDALRSRGAYGDVIGTDVWINGKKDNSIYVGWADGKKTWEKSNELRLASEA